jgi:hypothetical protein
MGRPRNTYGESSGTYGVLVGKPERRTPTTRLRSRWEDNIKMDLEKWDGARTGSNSLRIGTGGELL